MNQIKTSDLYNGNLKDQTGKKYNVFLIYFLIWVRIQY